MYVESGYLINAGIPSHVLRYVSFFFRSMNEYTRVFH